MTRPGTTKITVDRVAPLIEDMRDMAARLDRIENGQNTAQLPRAALDNVGLPVKGPAGETRVLIGAQDDGLHGVTHHNGPPPPKPTAPVLTGQQLRIRGKWDGGFVGGAVRPSDFLRVDVHLSDTPGFTHSDDTWVTSLFGAGAAVIPADATPQYVQLVCVSQSGAESVPSDEMTVTALPADDIAFGSVTAEHLEAMLILASEIVAGDPNAARVAFGPRGIIVTKSDGETHTFVLDADTGNLMFAGEWRTADSGERWVGNEAGSGDPSFRGYPATGTNYSEIRSTTPVTDRAGVLIRSATDASSRRSQLDVTPVGAVLQRLTGTGGNNSYAYAATGQVSLLGPEVVLYSDSRNPTASGDPQYIKLIHLDAAGVAKAKATLVHKANANAAATLANHLSNCALVWETDALHVTEQTGITHRAIYASAFTTASSQEGKIRRGPLPFSALDVVRAAPVSVFERVGGPEGVLHIGVMAEDVPEPLRKRNPMLPGGLGVGVDDQVSVVWAAVQELAAKVDSLVPVVA